MIMEEQPNNFTNLFDENNKMENAEEQNRITQSNENIINELKADDFDKSKHTRQNKSKSKEECDEDVNLKNCKEIKNNTKGLSVNQDFESKPKDRAKKNSNKKRKNGMKWPFIVLILTFVLSFTFSIGSQFLLTGAGIITSAILLVFFLALAMISDMIGVAVTSAEIEPFNAMSARKVKGAKESIKLVKNAEKVSSIFCDIVGDICGILSGTIGACLTLQITQNALESVLQVLIASIVSAVIAALTVFLKSIGKKIAINNSNKIIFALGKVLNFIKFKK